MSVEESVVACCRRMEKALKLLSDDHSLSACIALGHEPPVLGATSLSLCCFLSCQSLDILRLLVLFFISVVSMLRKKRDGFSVNFVKGYAMGHGTPFAFCSSEQT